MSLFRGVFFSIVFFFNLLTFGYSSNSKFNSKSSVSTAPSKNNTSESQPKQKCPPEEHIQMQSDSMSPLIKKGQYLNIQFNYKACGMRVITGNVVVVNVKGKKIIAKIYGQPGDRLKLKDDIIYVNELQCESSTESFLRNKYSVLKSDVPKNPTIIQKNKYLVLSDNDSQPGDSRRMGLIPEKDILGIVLLPKKTPPVIILPKPTRVPQSLIKRNKRN